MKIPIIFLFLILSFTGCRTYAPTTLENPGCKTVISGIMYCNGRWDKKVPVMFTKLDDGIRTRFGEIIERNDEGFIFKPDRTQNYGPYPKPKLFKYDDIICMLDSNAHIIYGSFPEKYLSFWGMIWELTSASKVASSIYLKIESNSYFSFCLEPDIYIVKSIQFINESESNYTDFSSYLPEIKINVKVDNNNYIGDIILDNLKFDDKFYKINCKIGQRPSDVIYGMIGLVGALANELDKSGQEIFHTIMIKDNLQSGDSRTKNIIQIKE
jgi:hypothetical protein